MNERHNEYQRLWRQRNPEKLRERMRRYRANNKEKVNDLAKKYRARWTEERKAQNRLVKKNNAYKRKYGITLEYYMELFCMQNGLCAICVKPKKLKVDHDHATGRVRGLLCDSCNVSLGRLGDNELAIRRVLKYLGG